MYSSIFSVIPKNVATNSVDWYSERVGEFLIPLCASPAFPVDGAQKRVIKEMRRDMGSGRQMNRLLQAMWVVENISSPDDHADSLG